MEKTDIRTFSKLFLLEDGKPIELEKWQLNNIINPLFYTQNSDGTRRYNLNLTGMPKKNGKSTLAALVAAYMLLADGESEVEVYGTAGSLDQAKIVFNQTAKAIKRSPILASEVNILRDVIERRDGRGIYKVLSSEAPLQHGLNASCVIFDEVWVHGSDYSLYEALTTSPARRQPLTFMISYAGYSPHEGNLLYDLYQRGKRGKDRAMWFYWTGKNNASWVSKGYLSQQKSRLPEHIYRRLHENQWTTGSGAFLSKLDVAAATDITLRNRFDGEQGKRYFASLDLGLRRDRTVFCIVHQETDGNVILDHLKTWQAPKGGEVSIQAVEDHILDLYPRFKFAKILFDPWQSIRTRQAFDNLGIRIEEFTFSGQNWVRLTEILFSLFKDRRIKIFPHLELTKELLTVKILEKSYGYRLDHDSGQHDDCVVSLAMSCFGAVAGKRVVTPRISMVDIAEVPPPKKGPPQRPKLAEGEQLVTVWEGDKIIKYEVLKPQPRPWLPGIRGGGENDGPSWLY